MSFTNNDIHNAAGPGSSAEPSMEEILASIRRILKEDEPGKPAEPVSAPVEMEDDVLLLDASMIARPADVSTATMMPASPMPATGYPAAPLQPTTEPLHFSSEPVPFSRDFGAITRAMPEPVVELPPIIDAEPQPLPEPAAYRPEPPAPEPPYIPVTPAPAATSYFSRTTVEPDDFRPPAPAPERAFPPLQAEPEPEPYRPSIIAPAAYTPPPYTAPAFAASAYTAPPAELDPVFRAPPAPAPDPKPQPAFTTYTNEPEPPLQAHEHLEPDMNDQANPNSFEPPDGLISDKTTDAAASSIGALVRSMTTEKSVAITKNSSVTIEDIVREEIRPLLKSWLDTHLPSLVERVVRSEIERVINRSVV
jgi:cell pole-organizing protein PopZ